MDISVNWPAVAFLFYLLCGLGFTIQGIVALGRWVAREWVPGPKDRDKVGSRADNVGLGAWRRKPAHQH